MLTNWQVSTGKLLVFIGVPLHGWGQFHELITMMKLYVFVCPLQFRLFFFKVTKKRSMHVVLGGD